MVRHIPPYAGVESDSDALIADVPLAQNLFIQPSSKTL